MDVDVNELTSIDRGGWTRLPDCVDRSTLDRTREVDRTIRMDAFTAWDAVVRPLVRADRLVRDST